MTDETTTLYVLFTMHYDYDDDSKTGYRIYRIHGIFTEKELIDNKELCRQIQEVRDTHSFNYMYVIPLNKIIKEGIKI
jgi:hypothetical protein